MPNLPTLLTLARIALVPAFVAVLFLPEAWIRPEAAHAIAAAIFIVCALTDWLDGYLARAWNQQTEFGAFLDPVADKILVCAALVSLTHLGQLHAAVASILVVRELAVSALREWMAQRSLHAATAVGSAGKWKTAVQLCAIPLMLVQFELGSGISTDQVGRGLALVAAVLAVVSAVEYFKSAVRALRAADTPAKAAPLKARPGPRRHIARAVAQRGSL